MAKNWRLLALAGLALAGCSSGAATAGSTASSLDVQVTVAPTTTFLAVATTTAPPPTTTTAPAPEVVEFVTPSGELSLKVIFPNDATDEELGILHSYERFLQVGDLISNDPSQDTQLIDDVSATAVKAKLQDSSGRLLRTGQRVRGSTRHIVSISEATADRVRVHDCFLDGASLYAADGSVVLAASDHQYLATAFLMQIDGVWKVRSFWTNEDQPCDS